MADNNHSDTSPNAGQGSDADKKVQTQAPADVKSKGDKATDEDTVTISRAEFDAAKRDQGRWQKSVKERRQMRHNQSRGTDAEDYSQYGDLSPEALEALRSRDEQIRSLTLLKETLSLKEKVRGMLESDNYKDLPGSLKKAILRNPLGFVTPEANSLDDAINDITDYLDEEMDNFDLQPRPEIKSDVAGDKGTSDNQDGEKHDIPPLKGGGNPSNNGATEEDLSGKTGSARTIAMINNKLQGQRSQQ